MSKKLSTQEKARRLWVRALRSGKYGWGKEALKPDDGRFCCLGVLCEVALKRGIISSYGHNASFLPDSVREWVGLEYNDGAKEYLQPLSEINDESKRNPFKKIANLIEKKPAGLFVRDEN